MFSMKKLLINILTLCISLSVIIVVSEVAIRFAKIAYEPQYDNRLKITRKSTDPKIRYELIPNYEGTALGGFVSVNSFGLRGPEISMDKPDGITRIAVLGDSWAFGWGVNQDEVVTAVLEKRLNESSDRKFEVINFSLYGYSLQQEEAVLAGKVLAFEPDFVIFAFNINDLEGLRLVPQNKGLNRDKKKGGDGMQKRDMPFKRRLFKAVREIEKFGNQHSHLFRLIDNALRGLAIYLHFENPGKQLHYERFYKADTREFQFLENAYRRIRKIADKEKVKVCIIYFPWMNELTQNNPYIESFEKVKKVAEQEGFLTMNLFPYYRGQDVSELRISNIDGHPTALGHEIAADAIKGFILQNLEHR